VTATYRYGLGAVGNLKAGSIKNPLDRPTGLRAAVNPLPSSAGTDPELLDDARDNAPNTVRTFGRVVSLRDFEDQARDFNGVAKALAVSAWDGEEQVVYLTVAGDGGVPLTQQTLDNLIADLDSRRDINRTVHVTVHKNVPLQISVGILTDAAFVAEDVKTAAQAALVDLLAFDHVDLGHAVHVSDVFAAVQAVSGVTACDVNLFKYKNAADGTSHGATSDSVQPHVRMFRDELPSLEDPTVDAAITLGMP
jgi:predicted phage baseplate assembly protein